MAERTRNTRSTAEGGKADSGFSEGERVAMRERAEELRATRRGGSHTGKANGETELLAKIAAMPEPDRSTCARLHAIIKASAPSLSPKTWYGMPAYANKEGKVVCFFRDAQKFHGRYLTLGFSQEADLDEGAMWPIAFALKELTPADEESIAALVRRAVS
jgi:hypothetical protein